ncbi:hypothetical protein [Oceanobacillus sp. CFH 90083]|uniref:hypothetical protein n=1 Tax=Oceanobacillus sp. CFH 90083 TaxID=2592336 RepID=UPI00128D7940|nr:hypothetical protein [Oceanobacillus sp. CFH 90083]
MITDPEAQEILEKELNHKLYIAEMQERLVAVTYYLISDDLYTVEHAIPELIKLINLLEKEQEGITYCIGKLDGISFKHRG